MLQQKHFDWLKRFAFGQPVIFSMLVILVAGLLTEIPFHIIFEPWVGESAAVFLEIIVGHTSTGLILLWLLVKLDLFKKVGFNSPRQWKALWLLWPLALFTLLNLESLFDGSLTIDTSRPGLIALYIVYNFTIGFCEEVMARGVVLSVMLQKWGNTRRGIYQAVLVSGALFGAAHIFNLLAGRLPALANVAQIAYSFVFGVAFAAFFLRNNSIWPVIVMHAAIDITGSLRHIAVDSSQIAVANNTLDQVISTLIIVLPLFLYSVFILRKVAPAVQLDASRQS